MFKQANYGVYRPNEWHQLMTPRRLPPAADRRLVVWCHEHGALGWWWSAQADDRACVSIVDGEQFCAASADLNGMTAWGNAGALTAIGQLWTQAINDLGVLSDKILIAGLSMGALTALNYTRQNPTKVKACLGITPAVSLPWHYDNGFGTPGSVAQVQAEIEAAYGGYAGYQAAIPAHSPYEGMDFPAGVPLALWTSTDDTFVSNARTHEYAAAVGAELGSLGAVGHSPGGGAFSPRFARWLRERA